MDMYANEDDEDNITTQAAISSSINDKGYIKEVEINGKKIMLVEASVVIRLENTIKTMQDRIIRLENDLRNFGARMANADNTIRSLKRDLDNKVSYEQ